MHSVHCALWETWSWPGDHSPRPVLLHLGHSPHAWVSCCPGCPSPFWPPRWLALPTPMFLGTHLCKPLHVSIRARGPRTQVHVLVPQLARGTYLRGMGFPGTPEATTAARGTPGDFTRDAQESIWTRQSWAEPSRPWRHLGPAVPLGPVSPASPPPPVNLPVALLCVLSLPVPCPLSLCLYPVRPLPLLCPLQVPLSHCPMSSGGLPLSPLMLPPPPATGTGWCAFSVQTQKPWGGGSVCRVLWASWTCKRGPDGREVLRPDATAWGPLHMDLGGRPAADHGNGRGGVWPTWPHGLPRRLNSAKVALWPACGSALRGGAQVGRGALSTTGPHQGHKVAGLGSGQPRTFSPAEPKCCPLGPSPAAGPNPSTMDPQTDGSWQKGLHSKLCAEGSQKVGPESSSLGQETRASP